MAPGKPINNKQPMNKFYRQRFSVLAGLALALISEPTTLLQAEGKPDSVPRKVEVTGAFDLSIVPPNLPPFVLAGTDGHLYLRNMPLVGKVTIAGEGFSLDGKISIELSGELDQSGTGPLWAPAVVTATIAGVKTIVFQGSATGDTVGLVSTGRAILRGRGPCEGTLLDFTFEEIGPANSDTYTLKGQLSPARRD